MNPLVCQTLFLTTPPFLAIVPNLRWKGMNPKLTHQIHLPLSLEQPPRPISCLTVIALLRHAYNQITTLNICLLLLLVV
jgi:hypothetical protein